MGSNNYLKVNGQWYTKVNKHMQTKVNKHMPNILLMNL